MEEKEPKRVFVDKSRPDRVQLSPGLPTLSIPENFTIFNSDSPLYASFPCEGSPIPLMWMGENLIGKYYSAVAPWDRTAFAENVAMGAVVVVYNDGIENIDAFDLVYRKDEL